MQKHTLKLTTLEIVYSDRDRPVEVLTMTPTELAGLKRSIKWKSRVTSKKLCEITVITKTL
jgi:hypothetical protein